MEAEYNALSMAMRDVFPLRNLAIEIIRGVGMSGNAPTTFITTVWEDTNGALKLATMEPGQTTPRSKAFGERYHWFRSKLKPNEIEVKKIAGIDQRVKLRPLPQPQLRAHIHIYKSKHPESHST
jgi:hypothetical protein